MSDTNSSGTDRSPAEELGEFIEVYSREQLEEIKEHLEDYREGTANARLIATDLELPNVVVEHVLQQLCSLHTESDQ